MEWIKYEESKPQNRQCVLFCVRSDFNKICMTVHKGVFLYKYINEIRDCSDVFISDDKGLFYSECVSYWMQSPNPPIE